MSQIEIDLATALKEAKVGTVRASCFVGAIVKMLEAGVPDSVLLPGHFQIRICPDPLPQAMRDELPTELTLWAIGNALKELDQFFSLFLDHMWDAVQATKLMLGQPAQPVTWPSIAADTNAASKHRKVLSAAGKLGAALEEDNVYISTLSDARNCLAHNLGIVDERRAPNGTFVLKWLRFKLLAQREGLPDIDLEEVGLPWTSDTD